VLFIYRPEYYKLDEFEDGSSTHRMAEVIIAKHRNGPTGDVKLRFIDTYAKFEDTDRGSDYSLSDVNAGIKTLPSKLNDMTDTEGEPF